MATVAALVGAACGGSGPATDTDPSLSPPPQRTTTTATEKSAATEPSARVYSVARPPIGQHRIRFGERRREETAAYAERHYGVSTTALDPKLIVEHVSVTPTAQGVFDTFAEDKPDVELHELPQVCSHFVVDRDGTICQLVSLRLICRHTVGLNDHAIGIEHVGRTDADILGDSVQPRASLSLTTWLRCRYGISIGNVIGHSESLSSPYHHERVASLRNQTHDDWTKADMDVYRAKLKKLRC